MSTALYVATSTWICLVGLALIVASIWLSLRGRRPEAVQPRWLRVLSGHPWSIRIVGVFGVMMGISGILIAVMPEAAPLVIALTLGLGFVICAALWGVLRAENSQFRDQGDVGKR